MRHGPAGRRQRNRGHHNNGGGNQGNQPRRNPNNRMRVFDSNGPDVRIRGTAHQVVEKYMALAKDAASSGDRIMAESYLQHAEHYQRIILSWGDVQDRPHDQRQSFAPADNVEAQPGNSAQIREDLSLPSSILGGVVKVNSEESSQARTGEFVG